MWTLGKVCSPPAADAVAGLGFHVMDFGIVSASFRRRIIPRRGLFKPQTGRLRPVWAHLPPQGLHQVPARQPQVGQHQERGDLRGILLQALVAHLGVAKDALEDTKDVLTARTIAP